MWARARGARDGRVALEVSVPEQKPTAALGMLRVDIHFGIGTSSTHAVGSRCAAAPHRLRTS